MFSVPLMYSITIGYSSKFAIQELTRELAFGSFEKSQVSALWSVRRMNGRASR